MAKKSFADDINSAKELIPGCENDQLEIEIPDDMFKNEYFKKDESRSRRLQLLIRPSLFANVKVMAGREGKSVNGYIHDILENAVKEAIKNE